jgi:hypothetical protein
MLHLNCLIVALNAIIIIYHQCIYDQYVQVCVRAQFTFSVTTIVWVVYTRTHTLHNRYGHGCKVYVMKKLYFVWIVKRKGVVKSILQLNEGEMDLSYMSVPLIHPTLKRCPL